MPVLGGWRLLLPPVPLPVAGLHDPPDEPEVLLLLVLPLLLLHRHLPATAPHHASHAPLQHLQQQGQGTPLQDCQCQHGNSIGIGVFCCFVDLQLSESRVPQWCSLESWSAPRNVTSSMLAVKAGNAGGSSLHCYSGQLRSGKVGKAPLTKQIMKRVPSQESVSESQCTV